LLQEVENVTSVKNRHARELMSRAGVIGVGVGADLGNPEIVVYVDRGMGRVPALPAQVENVKMRIVLTDAFVAR
jgi:hypothetical protein